MNCNDYTDSRALWDNIHSTGGKQQNLGHAGCKQQAATAAAAGVNKCKQGVGVNRILTIVHLSKVYSLQ